MKKFKTIVLGICCMLSIVIIVYFGEIINKGASKVEFIEYSLILLCSVVFLHWFVWHHFVPLSELSKKSQFSIQVYSRDFYKKSFFAGFIGLGYLFIFFFCFQYVIPDTTKKETLMPYNLPVIGIAFIIIGVLVKAHGVLRYLIKEKLEHDNTADRQATPASR